MAKKLLEPLIYGDIIDYINNVVFSEATIMLLKLTI
jgi:hypothetical protein